MHLKRDNVRETDGATDGQSENASQAQKLLFPAGSFPSRPPRSLSSVRRLSFLTRARPPVFPPSLSIRPSVSPLPIRQSLVRSPLAFPAREKSTRMYAKRRTRSRRGPSPGRSRGKILGAFFRGCRRTGGNGTAALIRFFASLCETSDYFPLINVVCSLKVLQSHTKFPAPRGNNSCDI